MAKKSSKTEISEETKKIFTKHPALKDAIDQIEKDFDIGAIIQLGEGMGLKYEEIQNAAEGTAMESWPGDYILNYNKGIHDQQMSRRDWYLLGIIQALIISHVDTNHVIEEARKLVSEIID